MTVTAGGVRTAGQLLSFIRDGGQPRYLLFWGHQPAPSGGIGKGCLSQWWPAAFTVDGVTYPSAEHFMMAGKALLFGDAETAERIRAAPHPGAAEALGRQVRGFDEQRWAERRFDLVITGNLAEFGQHRNCGTSCSAPAAGSWPRPLRSTGSGVPGWLPATSTLHPPNTGPD